MHLRWSGCIIDPNSNEKNPISSAIALYTTNKKEYLKKRTYFFYSNKRAENAKITSYTEISTENEGRAETVRLG